MAVLNSETEVRRALDNEEFVPYFQPLIALRTGRLVGYEVLTRWLHPTEGLVMPGHFIPHAEKNGWIDIMSRQVLRRALATAVELPGGPGIAVNVSPVQLRDLTLARDIHDAAEQTGFALGRLTVEITETSLTDDTERALIIAKELKLMGCKLALDDFGTGYSSLLHLQMLPFDEIKVDRSFVSSMPARRESRKIVAAVVGLGQNLGLTTVAEGVETEDQAELLLWLGCDLGQGLLYGPPLSSEALFHLGETALPSRPQGVAGRWTAASFDALGGMPAQKFAQLQAIYDSVPVGLAFLDSELRFVNINQRLADMNGLPVAAHLGRSLRETVPEVFPQAEPQMRRALAGEVIFDVEVTRTVRGEVGQRTLLVSYQPVRDEAQEVIGVLTAITDITERKRAEDTLRESEAHYRHMVELNPQIPWTLDAQGGNLEVSAKWATLTGLSVEEAKGDGWLAVVHPEDRERVVALVRSSLATGTPMDVKYRVRRPGGQWCWVRSRGSPRFNSSGEVMRWYGSVEEIDECNLPSKGL